MSLPRYWILAFRLATVLTIIMIAYLAFTPSQSSNLLMTSDKVTHFLAFFTVVFLVDFSFPYQGLNWQKIGVCLTFAVLIELIQAHLPYRDFSFLDMLADVGGLLLYALLQPSLKYLPVLKKRWA